MKQTAVEFLIDKWSTQGTLYSSDISQAKEIEKEKHIKWNNFLENEKAFGISDVKSIERIQWYYNTYFNETYGK